MRLLLPILLSCAPILGLGAEDSTPPARTSALGVPSSQDASAIAAQIIHQRALDLAGSGDTAVATELENLAHGLSDGHISLADAALVMAIANVPRPAAVPLTPEAKAAARQAESLLDGDGSGIAHASAPVAGAGAAAAAPAGDASGSAAAQPPGLALPTMPPKDQDKAIGGKIYAVDDGTEGKVVSAAIGIGTNAGVKVGSRFVIKRDDLTIARATVFKVTPTLSYAAIDQGSLADPRNDVKEGDRAELLP